MLCHLQHPQVSLKKSPRARSSCSWESLFYFARRFHIEKIRKIPHMTQRNLLLEPFLSQYGEKRGQRHPSWVYPYFFHPQVNLDCCKTHSPCSALAFARTKPDFGAWAAELQDLGQNFMSQAELCEAVCSGKVPFYLCELAAFFSMQGYPLESLLQRNSVQTLMKTVTLPPSPNSPWVYGPEEKCSHPAKQQEENHLPKIKLFSNFFFFFFSHSTSLWVALQARQQ